VANKRANGPRDPVRKKGVWFVVFCWGGVFGLLVVGWGLVLVFVGGFELFTLYVKGSRRTEE